ncbi:MAG: tRNA threonylcarbamoyladenosine dehydratase [Filifactoraceae bacterium]
MDDRFLRTKLLIGDRGMEKLKGSHVAIYGVGGVGGFAVEALVRSGVGEVSIIDFDKVELSNINRQIIANDSSVGRVKVEVMKERLLAINPKLKLNCFSDKYTSENRVGLSKSLDFVVDAIDIVTSKLDLLEQCVSESIPVISSMGMGNRLDPSRIKLGDLAKTNNCALAKVVRRELRKRGIEHLMVVYSDEEAVKLCVSLSSDMKREIPGSCSFVPSVAGLFMAGYVVRNLANDHILG